MLAAVSTDGSTIGSPSAASCTVLSLLFNAVVGLPLLLDSHTNRSSTTSFAASSTFSAAVVDIVAMFDTVAVRSVWFCRRVSRAVFPDFRMSAYARLVPGRSTDKGNVAVSSIITRYERGVTIVTSASYTSTHGAGGGGGASGGGGGGSILRPVTNYPQLVPAIIRNYYPIITRKYERPGLTMLDMHVVPWPRGCGVGVFSDVPVSELSLQTDSIRVQQLLLLELR